MEDKLISFRIGCKEYEALRKLAAREVRSMAGWLKFRIIMEATRAGLLSVDGFCQDESSLSIVEQKAIESREGVKNHDGQA